MKFHVQLTDQSIFTVYVDPPMYVGENGWYEETLIPAVLDQDRDPDLIDDYWSSTDV